MTYCLACKCASGSDPEESEFENREEKHEKTGTANVTFIPKRFQLKNLQSYRSPGHGHKLDPSKLMS